MSNAKSNANRNFIRTLRAKAGLALLLAGMVAAGAAFFSPGPNAPTVASSAWPPGPSAPAMAVSDTPPGPGAVGPEF